MVVGRPGTSVEIRGPQRVATTQVPVVVPLPEGRYTLVVTPPASVIGSRPDLDSLAVGGRGRVLAQLPSSNLSAQQQRVDTLAFFVRPDKVTSITLW